MMSGSKLVVKNTIMLYIRTFLVMLVSLYTSRVILRVLGIEDYGIYQAVGGAVALFSVVSGAFSSSISRFITFELGRENLEKLNRIFSVSIIVVFVFGFCVLVLGETVGFWFLQIHMNIPLDRVVAANWVLFLSLLAFVINLISVPYNAVIIAHEKMGVFAYVSILDVFLRLLIVFLVEAIDSHDRLIIYSAFNVVVSLIIRIIYGIYCKTHFQECVFRMVYDRQLLKEMFQFAGWSFLTNGAYIFNTQGINVLINVFFGVVYNAARGIAVQVDGGVTQFVNNFTTALNPQITKLYAKGDKKSMFQLVCNGAKFSYCLMLFFAIPIILEVDTILRLWLGISPTDTALFIRLGMLSSIVTTLGNTQVTACMATGNIRKYSIVITLVGSLVFPLSWLVYSIGCSAEFTYYICIVVYMAVLITRLFIMRDLLKFPPMMFIRNVLCKIIVITIVAIILPLILYYYMDATLTRLLLIIVSSLVSVCFAVYMVGINKDERGYVKKVLYNFVKKYLA